MRIWWVISAPGFPGRQIIRYGLQQSRSSAANRKKSLFPACLFSHAMFGIPADRSRTFQIKDRARENKAKKPQRQMTPTVRFPGLGLRNERDPVKTKPLPKKAAMEKRTAKKAASPLRRGRPLLKKSEVRSRHATSHDKSKSCHAADGEDPTLALSASVEIKATMTGPVHRARKSFFTAAGRRAIASQKDVRRCFLSPPSRCS